MQELHKARSRIKASIRFWYEDDTDSPYVYFDMLMATMRSPAKREVTALAGSLSQASLLDGIREGKFVRFFEI
jgi:hypothetical protein